MKEGWVAEKKKKEERKKNFQEKKLNYLQSSLSVLIHEERKQIKLPWKGSILPKKPTSLNFSIYTSHMRMSLHPLLKHQNSPRESWPPINRAQKCYQLLSQEMKLPGKTLPYAPTATTEGSLEPASIDILQYGEISVGTETEGYIHTSPVISPTTNQQFICGLWDLVRRHYFAAFFSWRMIRDWQKGLLAVSC